ncbi:unnamed protein product [Allacma fusca]|uniref:Uncharacterized protein n=1 Tax=Allacma fusca TaxID=39272 RepID=A0A8J2P8F0_9HEXA|nr:unnamed protein product [Allacma fusca]
MLTKLLLILSICASTQSLSHSTEKILVKEFEPQSKLSMETHKKIYSYTKNANFFKNLTFEETMDFMNELNEWEAPKEIKDHFGYSLWGYDLERRPGNNTLELFSLS